MRLAVIIRSKPSDRVIWMGIEQGPRMTHQMNILPYQMMGGSNPTFTIFFYWAIKDTTAWYIAFVCVVQLDVQMTMVFVFCFSPDRCIEGKKEHWYPNPMVVIKDVIDMNKLQFAVWSQHRMNHQNMGERWARRACLVEEMIDLNFYISVNPKIITSFANITILE